MSWGFPQERPSDWPSGEPSPSTKRNHFMHCTTRRMALSAGVLRKPLLAERRPMRVRAIKACAAPRLRPMPLFL